MQVTINYNMLINKYRNRIPAILAIFSGCILIPACTKTINFPAGTPPCIRDKIVEISQEEVWNPPAKIYSYYYLGQTVYYFPSRCCDIPGTLFDKDCNIICSPDGGLTGKGDGQCSDFLNQRSEEKVIWEDPRK